MSNLPLVTVMIPTYNQAAVLPAAIASVMKQQYTNIEIVVCDDRSPDNTMQVLEQYKNESRVKVFQNEKNLGRVGNYKHILENLATGEWVVNLDGDDFFTDPMFISDSIKYIMESKSEIVFCQAGQITKTIDGKTISVSLPNISSEYEVINGKDYFLNFHHFSHLATIFNRKKAIDINFYRFNILSTDIESFLRLSLQGDVILVKRAIGVWVHHASNESKNLSLQNVDRNMLRFEAPYKYARSLNIFQPAILNKWRLKKLYGYLLSYLTLYFTNSKLIPGYLKHVWKSYPLNMTMMLIPYAYLRAKGKKTKSADISEE